MATEDGARSPTRMLAEGHLRVATGGGAPADGGIAVRHLPHHHHTAKKAFPSGEAMSTVITKFAVMSMLMWMVPVAIVYGFNHQIFPGVGQLSPSAQTLASGFLAVISVNLVIGFYIYMAMKETPHQEPQPDPTFLANAKASINQPTSSQVSDDSHGKGKVE